MECGDGRTFNAMAYYNEMGFNGMPADHAKAFEMNLQAGKLGHANGYFNVGNAYWKGKGMAADIKKARKYYELAAMGGHVQSRLNIGLLEEQSGNVNRAIKHLLIAASDGDNTSLTAIKLFHKDGKVSKDDFEKTLRSYQKSHCDMKSDMRRKAERMEMT